MDLASMSVKELLAGLTFYRQKRRDGGFRMGVELDQEPILEHFEEGDEERDPVLVWYVDVRCKGPGVPTTLESARQWFLSSHRLIEDGLAAYADQLRGAGVDKDDYPSFWSDFPDLGDGITKTIACSVNRRADARALSEILDDVRLHWSERLETMIAEQVEYSSKG